MSNPSNSFDPYATTSTSEVPPDDFATPAPSYEPPVGAAEVETPAPMTYNSDDDEFPAYQSEDTDICDGRDDDSRLSSEGSEPEGYYDADGNYYEGKPPEGATYGGEYPMSDSEEEDEEDAPFRDEEDGVYRDDPEADGVFKDDDESEQGKKKKKKKKRKWLKRQKKEANERKRRRRRRLCCIILCCLCLILLILLLWFLWPRKEPEEILEDDQIFDDDYIPTNPFQGIQTTPMDPYTGRDCYHADNIYPHTLSQCECNNEKIDNVPDDAFDLYLKVRDIINREFYNGRFNEDYESCSFINHALYWLSSGNTRDAGELFSRYALALNFYQLNGTYWDYKDMWMSDESECLWLGLQCSGKFELSNFAMENNNIKGSIPTELAYLSTLKTVAITRSHLVSTIPDEIFQMPNLEYLQLYANELTGSIPASIEYASNLRSLRVDNNFMVGALVPQIGKATNLTELSISFNEFLLTIPMEITQLTNMKRLVLENNRFSGTLHTEFGYLTDMRDLNVYNTLIDGDIPEEFTRMTMLENFNVANSGLGGIIPKGFGNITTLKRLELGNGRNNFEGTIHTEFGQLTGLTFLALNDNEHLTGPIPTELGNLKNLTRLLLSHCDLTGTIPTELSELLHLQNFRVDGNRKLTGSLPAQMCDIQNLTTVTDCYSRGGQGIQCNIEVKGCCDFCRRGDFYVAPETNTTFVHHENGTFTELSGEKSNIADDDAAVVDEDGFAADDGV